MTTGSSESWCLPTNYRWWDSIFVTNRFTRKPFDGKLLIIFFGLGWPLSGVFSHNIFSYLSSCPSWTDFCLEITGKSLLLYLPFWVPTHICTSTTVIRTYKVPVNCEWIVHVFLLQQHLSLHKNLIKTLVSFNFPCFPWREGDGQMNRGTDERQRYPSFENYGFFYKQLTAFNSVFLWFDFLSNKNQPIFWRLSMHFRIVNYCGLLFIWMKLD